MIHLSSDTGDLFEQAFQYSQKQVRKLVEKHPGFYPLYTQNGRWQHDGPAWTDAEIAKAFDCRTKTVENIRERLVTEGFEIALNGNPKTRVRRKVLDGDQEAKIIALRLGPPPKGFANWTLRLLAEQAVALEIVESVSHETLRGTLKKTTSRKRRSSIG